MAFGLEVELGSMPYAFIKAVEETVRETLGQGIHGWQIPDARVVIHNHPYYVSVLAALGVLPELVHQTGALFLDKERGGPGCEGVIWPPRDGSASPYPAGAPRRERAASAPPVDDTPFPDSPPPFDDAPPHDDDDLPF